MQEKITNLLLLIVCLTSFSNVSGQAFEWAYSAGGSQNDFSGPVHMDASGNIYSIGLFGGTMDFDPSSATVNRTPVGGRDIYIQKLSPAGNLIWVKTIGGPANDSGLDFFLDSLDNIYLTGLYRSTVDFNPGSGVFNLTSSGGQDAFVLKLDANGDFVWARSFASSSDNEGLDIAVDGNGAIYTIGSFAGTVDMDPSANTFNLSSAGSRDIFVQKMDSNGAFVWAFQLGNTGFDRAEAVTVDANGDVLVTGVFSQTVDFDPSVGGANNLTAQGNSRDIFIMKINGMAQLQWAGNYGGSSSIEGAYSIETDAAGNIYSCGSFQGTGDMDPGSGTFNLTPVGSNDAFVQKLDPNGNLLWVRTLGSTVEDEAYYLTLDRFGNVYSTGYFFGTIDFDPGPGVSNLTGDGNGDIYVQKLDANGDFVWAYDIESSTGSIISYGIDVDFQGGVCVTGQHVVPLDADPGPGVFTLTPSGGFDFFLQKVSQANFCPATSATISVSSCGGYTSPSGDLYSTSGTYLDTLVNANGCDSVLTINLTVNQASASSETISECDAYFWQGNTYTSSGTYLDTIQNAAGCDSILSLNLTINQTSTSTENITECEAYFWQGNTYTTSGTYIDTLQNAAGCDSILTLNLTINANTASSENVSVCDSYIWRGVTYTNSGVYTDTISNAAGCDSVLTLNLILTTSTSSFETATACGNYLWQGNLLTSSGTYNDTITNAVGCDSIMTLNLTINQATASSENTDACESYFWQGTTYSSSGTYVDTIVNAAGCDSVLTLNLTITQLDTSVSVSGGDLTANQAGATYQWLDCDLNMPIAGATGNSFSPLVTGNYAVVVTLNGCQDTSGCRTVTLVGRELAFEEMVEVYPNPNAGRFTVSIPSAVQGAEMMVFDLQGKLVARQHLLHHENHINLQHLPQGTYMMQLMYEGKRSIKRVSISL